MTDITAERAAINSGLIQAANRHGVVSAEYVSGLLEFAEVYDDSLIDHPFFPDGVISAYEAARTGETETEPDDTVPARSFWQILKDTFFS